MKTYNKWYPLKVWLATLINSPLFIATYELLFNKPPLDSDWFLIWPIVILLSLILSLPTLLIYSLAYFLLCKNKAEIIIVKVVAIMVAIIGLYLTIYVLNSGTLNNDSLLWPLTYVIAIIVYSILFKIETTTKLL